MRGCHDEAGVGRAITNDEPVDLVLQLGASWSDDRYQLDAFENALFDESSQLGFVGDRGMKDYGRC